MCVRTDCIYRFISLIPRILSQRFSVFDVVVEKIKNEMIFPQDIGSANFDEYSIPERENVCLGLTDKYHFVSKPSRVWIAAFAHAGVTQNSVFRFR